jgi:hypothetical protein
VGFRFRCKVCLQLYNVLDIELDHEPPVVDPEVGGPTFSLEHGAQGWDTYLTRLFAPQTGYRVLCKFCHHENTQKQKDVRVKTRRSKK